MIYVEYDKSNRIVHTHFMPFDTTDGLGKSKEELLKTGALIELPLEPEKQESKIAVMFYNRTDNTAFYKLEDMPIQSKTKEEQLQEQVNQLALTVLQIQTQIGGAI